MKIQEFVLDELQIGVNILQKQHDWIVQEASELIQGIHAQVQDMFKRQSDTSWKVLAMSKSISKLNKQIKIWKKAQQSYKNMLGIFEQKIQSLPTLSDSDRHGTGMEGTHQTFRNYEQD